MQRVEVSSNQRRRDVISLGGHNSGGLFEGTSGSRKTMNILNSVESATKRDSLMGEAKTEQTRKLINELYRKNSTVGDGGTADAIRKEKQSKEAVGGKSHIQKGKERLKQINRILDKNPDHPDKKLLQSLRDDLKNALGGN